MGGLESSLLLQGIRCKKCAFKAEKQLTRRDLDSKWEGLEPYVKRPGYYGWSYNRWWTDDGAGEPSFCGDFPNLYFYVLLVCLHSL